MRRLASFALVISLSWPAAALPELTLGPAAHRSERRRTLDRVIAVVGGIPVFSSQLEMLIRGTEGTLRSKPDPVKKELLRKATRDAYQSLIEQALIEAAGARVGERVGDEEVQSAIEQWVPRYWASRQQARTWGMSSEEYDRSVRIALLEQRLLARFVDRHRSKVSGDDAWRHARKRWLEGLARSIHVERRLAL